MKIVIEKMLGDASVMIYNKQGELIHTEGFYGKTESQYIREIPVARVEFGSSKALHSGLFKYTIVD